MSMLNIPIPGVFGTLVRLSGCGLMLYATLKLRKYCKAFDLTLIGVALMICMSVALLFANGNLIIGYVDQGVSFVFSMLLLWGIFSIARETEARKIVVGAIRNAIFVGLYAFLYLLSFLPFEGIRSAASEFAVITWILYFVCIGLNLFLIFSTYAEICDEDDVDMSKRTAKIPLLNGFIDRFEQKAQAAKAEDRRYRQEKRNNRKKRKKK